MDGSTVKQRSTKVHIGNRHSILCIVYIFFICFTVLFGIESNGGGGGVHWTSSQQQYGAEDELLKPISSLRTPRNISLESLLAAPLTHRTPSLNEIPPIKSDSKVGTTTTSLHRSHNGEGGSNSRANQRAHSQAILADRIVQQVQRSLRYLSTVLSTFFCRKFQLGLCGQQCGETVYSTNHYALSLWSFPSCFGIVLTT